MVTTRSRSGAARKSRSRANLWLAINAFNHAIYAVLFLVRSFFYAGVGDGDRPFFFESYLLEALLPPPLCAAFGWAGPPDRLQILAFVKSCNADAEAGLKTYGWPIGVAVSNHTFMYFYQIVEGIFHLMIVIGSVWLSFRSGACSRSTNPGCGSRLFGWTFRTFTRIRWSRCGGRCRAFRGSPCS